MKRALLLVPVLLVAACGGGGGDAAAGSKAAFVKQAEAICTKANTARKAEKTPTSAQELPAYVRRVVTLASDASAELNALEPPKKDAAELDAKFLGPLREQVGRGQAFATQVEKTSATGDTAAVLKLLGSAPLSTTADVGFVRSYGMTACADAANPTG